MVMNMGHFTRRTGVLLVTLWSIMLLGNGCQKRLATVIMERHVRTMTLPRDHLLHMQYLVQLPRGYDGDTNRVWPLVFYLHGIGESGNNLDKVIRYGPPQVMIQKTNLPCIVVSPQVPKGYFPFMETDGFLEILDEVTARYRVDKRRVHATGNSMGAYGALALVAREPKRFASLVPVCGGVSYLDSLRLRDVPIWAFHGEKDPIIPVAESRRLVELVNQIGGQTRLTIYPGVGHNAWELAYDDPALWEWMLDQTKK